MPLVDTRGFNLQSDSVQDFGQGVSLGRGISQFRRESEIRDILGKAVQPPTQQQTQLSEQSAGLGPDTAIQNTREDLINQARSIDPVMAQEQLKALGLTDNLKRAEASRFASQLQNTPFEQRAGRIQARAASLQAQGRDAKDTIELIDMDEQQQNQALTGVQLLDLTTQQRFNIKKSAKRGFAAGASEREFNNLIKNFSEADQIEARRVKAGLAGRAVGSAAQTIAEEGTAELIGRSSAKIKSSIKKAVVLAESKAKETGEVLTDLSRARAALPGLNQAVSELRKLAPIATSTLTGKAWNSIVRESGFGSTKGSTARAKFIATINNQVLPLLKPTFGAAFTVPEGDALRATMGDPDATPEEKLAQLDSFIAQKMRDIESKERQLQPSSEAKPVNQMTADEIRAELAGGN